MTLLGFDATTLALIATACGLAFVVRGLVSGCLLVVLGGLGVLRAAWPLWA